MQRLARVFRFVYDLLLARFIRWQKDRMSRRVYRDAIRERIMFFDSLSSHHRCPCCINLPHNRSLFHSHRSLYRAPRDWKKVVLVGSLAVAFAIALVSRQVPVPVSVSVSPPFISTPVLPVEPPPLLLLQPPPTPPSPIPEQPSSVAVPPPPPPPPPKPKLPVVPQPSPATSAEQVQEPQLPIGELVALVVAVVAAMHPKRNCSEDDDDDGGGDPVGSVSDNDHVDDNDNDDEPWLVVPDDDIEIGANHNGNDEEEKEEEEQVEADEQQQAEVQGEEEEQVPPPFTHPTPPQQCRLSRSPTSRVAANEVPTIPIPQPPLLPLLRRSPRLALLPRVSYVGMC